VVRTKLKIDLHVHTTASLDSFIELKDAVKTAEKIGLDGFAVTDHDTIENALLGMKVKTEIIVLPGIEVTSKEGHILGVGLTEKVPKNLPAKETVETIRELGGVAVVPHPFDPLKHGVGEKVALSTDPDAIETMNSNSLFFNSACSRSSRLADEMQKPKTGGSDAHLLPSLGRVYTEIEAESPDLTSILQSIREGKTTPVGEPTPIKTRIHHLIKTSTRLMQ
jgi:predicted metal-dependent phosphoesterase TrpH